MCAYQIQLTKCDLTKEKLVAHRQVTSVYKIIVTICSDMVGHLVFPSVNNVQQQQGTTIRLTNYT